MYKTRANFDWKHGMSALTVKNMCKETARVHFWLIGLYQHYK